VQATNDWSAAQASCTVAAATGITCQQQGGLARLMGYTAMAQLSRHLSAVLLHGMARNDTD